MEYRDVDTQLELLEAKQSTKGLSRDLYWEARGLSCLLKELKAYRKKYGVPKVHCEVCECAMLDSQAIYGKDVCYDCRDELTRPY